MYWDEDLGAARFVVSERSGGVSASPFDGLDLALHVGDDPLAVQANRERFASYLGLAPDHVVYAEQVHGSVVVQVDEPVDGPPPRCDALVTRTPGLALTILVADCVPVLLADPAAGVVGVAHAGRKGMASGVAARLAAAMRDLGARAISARLGPSVCPRCYPVPIELREQVASAYPESRSLDWHAQPAIDVAAGVLAQLAPLCSDLRQLPGCTVEDPRFFSYRRDGATGRFAGVALLRERAA